MPTPAEHYLEAERLLRAAEQAYRDAGKEQDTGVAAAHVEAAQVATAEAQVHATLATFRPQPETPPTPEDVTGWLYCTCPRDSSRGRAVFGTRISDDPECPIHGHDEDEQDEDGT
jgi:predicted trehalose synthase